MDQVDDIAGIASDEAMLSRVRITQKRLHEIEAEAFFLAAEWAQRHTPDEDCDRFWCRTDERFASAVCEGAIGPFAAMMDMRTEAATWLLLEALETTNRLPRLFTRVREGQVRPWAARKVAAETLPLSDEAADFVDRQVSISGMPRGAWRLAGIVRQAMITHMPAELAALDAEQGDPRKVRVTAGEQGLGWVDACLDGIDAAQLDHAVTHGAARLKDTYGSAETVDVRRAHALGDLARAATGIESLDLEGLADESPHPAEQAAADPAEAADPMASLAPTGSMAPTEPVASTGRMASTGPMGPVGPTGSFGSSNGRARWPGRRVPEPTIMAYLHLNASAFGPDAEAGGGVAAPGEAGTWNTGTRSADTAKASTGSVCGAQGSAGPDTSARWAHEPVHLEGGIFPAGTTISADQLASMFARPTTCDGPSGAGGVRIIVRPVIDAGEDHELEGYQVSDRVKEQLYLRDGTCVFPHCTRTARICDADHIDPWHADHEGRSDGGPTCTCNLAPLCRTHHRWKTHAASSGHSPGGGWNYLMLAPGTYYWTGPYGLRFLRSATGTIEVTDDAWHLRDLHERRDELDRRAMDRLAEEYGWDDEDTRALEEKPLLEALTPPRLLDNHHDQALANASAAPWPPDPSRR